ncbi:hypothetical protein LOK49_LG02G01080 [Camellia lanceoleosa]|uniref:Uncharacterized protein n=1 Tax=Camellia lanceoleosa TaxID=1840588 RepID=A0ACC0IU47_9ERIC|nr:hypothetical protein LOK49_LG02G01080 [Camellia lanceoleosa]
MLLPTPPGCVSSTTVCVSSGGCISSEHVNGVPIPGGHASEADNTLALVAFFRRPVFIPGTMNHVKLLSELRLTRNKSMQQLGANNTKLSNSPIGITTPNIKSTAMALTSHIQLKEKAVSYILDEDADVDEDADAHTKIHAHSNIIIFKIADVDVDVDEDA